MLIRAIGNRQENRFAVGKRDVWGLRIRRKAGEPAVFWAGVVGVTAIFADVADIDIAVHQEVGVQRQSQQATVIKRVDERADVQEWGGEQLAVLIEANHAVALPDEHAPVAGPRDPDW